MASIRGVASPTIKIAMASTKVVVKTSITLGNRDASGWEEVYYCTITLQREK